MANDKFQLALVSPPDLKGKSPPGRTKNNDKGRIKIKTRKEVRKKESHQVTNVRRTNSGAIRLLPTPTLMHLVVERYWSPVGY